MLNDIMMALLALLISLILVPFVAKLAIKIGAVDKPNERKVHTKIMPRMGGLAIYLSFFAVLFLSHEMTMQHIGLLTGGTVLVLVGIIDDKTDMPAKIKLLGQIFAACIVVAAGVRVEFMTNFILGGVFPLYIFSVPFTVLWIVAITNAVNLIDGLDGLAAGTSIIAAATMAISGYATGQTEMASMALILIGASLGFLKYNFHPAKIFMGDTGSMFLGYNLSVLAIMGFTKSFTVLSLVTPILVLAIPILDTLFAIIRRKMNNKPIFKPDKNHLHHCLLNYGFSHRNTVLIIYAVSAVLALCGLIMTYLNPAQGMCLLVVISVIIIYGAMKLGVIGKHDSAKKDDE
ncbi:MAG: undecaprenyl/decaprenyl-phosphate alpha-N-acetylglucosaminyl 1-phosphate transferase [Peptococcaceae bacterium]|jgi:UDP-GlcNAc:undecaprenyl-phosphate GlcNAc-1-phosphate transferase|nr:undecaprenyl/decaprenyl-phosphate alpha-N-acetylglucosaminyl 1-phosphate transferase [Peptococcaceae bacterium]MBQ2022079.1 undecaprenyl/decaprenyl-phosphate alpha-N-acetylglucosaminyl 1-phosphate transferase [Peptococcaceae bacterium]MBQ2368663.1 undecaprenyl/decaprenyl-phosphate alpha-N-acetylglucosaminyl 1-phosphate transferase [Peptococcaceae bacterium]MBQ5616053.1 undecaprenyl/decaprenyl-phosphate alpha-N-acetylglucosaminyl 1-phosphate transferase [Peptococcaceae bacterium]MBR0449146.1 